MLTKNAIKNIIFINEPNISTISNTWYTFVNNLYANIAALKYPIIKKHIVKHDYFVIDFNLLNILIRTAKPTDLYIFNPINFATFHNYSRQAYGDIIKKFLKNIKYIVIWQEVLNEDLSIIGYACNINKAFVKYFFQNSKLNIVSNSSSMKSLIKHGINHNLYSTVVGFSPTNKILPLVTTNYEYDILIYGTLSNSYPHRTNTINKIFSLNVTNKVRYRISKISGTFGNALDNYLRKTKVVVHIPSYPNSTHIPWAKIALLQAKKVFYIIEEVAEIYEKKLQDIIVYYKRGDVNDLFSKIKYYLTNEPNRQVIIERNHQYITKTTNMDTMISDIVVKY